MVTNKNDKDSNRFEINDNLLQGKYNAQDNLKNVPLTPDTMCGFWCLKNTLLQKFANQTSYVVVYGLVGCSLAMTSSYYMGTISTMEKRFKIPSRNTGFILAGNDIAQMLCAWFLGYYVGRKHRPRWMSLGILTFVSFCLLTASPHFLYGSGQQALDLTEEYNEHLRRNQSLLERSTDDSKNLCHSADTEEICHSNEQINWLPQVILFLAQFIAGIGSSLYYTLGITYMDDNTEKSKAPAMLSLSYFCGLLGPACGYSLASFCLSLYISPSLTPLIDQRDSRWLGAWWLGWLILAAVLLLCAFLIFLFPKELPAAAARRLRNKNEGESVGEKASLKDMLQTLKRFRRNHLLVYNMMSSLFYCFGYSPYWFFTAKYIELQYHQTASTSSMVTGTVALVFSAVGILLAGFVLSKYKPRARYLAAWSVVVELITVSGFMAYAFIGCSANDNILNYNVLDRGLNDMLGCNMDCHCDYVPFIPICGDNDQTYISPCHAGCHSSQLTEEGVKIYSDCDCTARNKSLYTDYSEQSLLPKILRGGYAKEGFCPIDCYESFITFLAVMCCLKFFAATGRASNLLITMRSVDAKDKAAIMGLGMMLVSLVTFIPAPIFFGWLFDSFCLVWGKTCTHKGNCWLYDSKHLRLTMNFVSSGFIVISIFLDFGVWYHAKNLQVFDDNSEQTSEELISVTTRAHVRNANSKNYK